MKYTKNQNPLSSVFIVVLIFKLNALLTGLINHQLDYVLMGDFHVDLSLIDGPYRM